MRAKAPISRFRRAGFSSSLAPPLPDSSKAIGCSAFLLEETTNWCTLLERSNDMVMPSIAVPITSSRLHQIKQEEEIGLVNREAMHERKVQIAMQMSQTLEESFNMSDSDCQSMAMTPSSFSPTRGIKKSSMWSQGSCPSPSHKQREIFPKKIQNSANTLQPSALGSLKRKEAVLGVEDESKRFFQRTPSNLPPEVLDWTDKGTSLSTVALSANKSNRASSHNSAAVILTRDVSHLDSSSLAMPEDLTGK